MDNKYIESVNDVFFYNDVDDKAVIVSKTLGTYNTMYVKVIFVKVINLNSSMLEKCIAIKNQESRIDRLEYSSLNNCGSHIFLKNDPERWNDVGGIVFDLNKEEIHSQLSKDFFSDYQRFVLNSKNELVQGVLLSNDEKIIITNNRNFSYRETLVKRSDTLDVIGQLYDHHCYNISRIALNCENNKILTYGTYENLSGNYINLYNLSKDTIERIYEYRVNSPINELVFSKDGNTFLSGSSDKKVTLRNLKNGHVISEFEGHDFPVISIAYSKCGKKAYSADSQGNIKEWDLPKIEYFKIEHSEHKATIKGYGMKCDINHSNVQAEQFTQLFNRLIDFAIEHKLDVHKLNSELKNNKVD